MSTLRDKLHNRIDQREALANDARALAKRVTKERLGEALNQTDTVEDALQLLAGWVAEELSELTHRAVKAGAAAAQAKRGK